MGNVLLWGGVVGGPLFVIIFLIEGFLRRGYHPLRQPVSALSIGPRGWVQQANFFINGTLVFLSAFGLSSAFEAYGGSWWAPVLIGIYGASTVGAGLFKTDVHGLHKPHSAPSKRTRAALIHDLFSSCVFISLFVACFVVAHLFFAAGEEGWYLYSATTGILYGAGFLVFARGFARASKFAPIAGLLQRATISLGVIWLSLVALHLLGLL